tara:strand:- start:1187 stop:1981 length:795 start_codon:yes stop_codon:yes gene_type:complete
MAASLSNSFFGNIAFLKNSTILAVLLGLCAFLYIPAFVYGFACLWMVSYLFMFMYFGRALCQSSIRRYETKRNDPNKTPKIKLIVITLCTYLSLPFLLYIFIMGDLNALVSSGLDRTVIMILPLDVMKLPIVGDPSVFQMLLLQQLFLSFFGFGGGMLFARKEIGIISLPKLPQNIPWRDDLTKEEKKKYNNLWGSYYFLGGAVLIPAIFSLVFATSFFSRFWADSDIHILEYIFVVPSIYFMPYVLFLHFFAAAVIEITTIRS